ncbi:MAG: FHA domain-containing protein [Armatimonadetes bacterium]|nr:FHA domain-containing protein [Armatimonadota bacterium]
MSNINTPRLILLALAGAVAGLIIFAIVDPSMAREELTGHGPSGIGELFSSGAILGFALASAIGGMLALANELGMHFRRMAIRTIGAIAIGALAGTIAGLVAEAVFLVLVFAGGLVIGRTVGWAILGAGAGVGVGYVLGGWPRAKMSMLGGLIGGGVGGMFFDVVALVSGGGSASRFIGFIIMGAATGAAVAMAEEVAKQSWVTVLTGAREGKSYILTKSTTSLGRDELADIPLFGDPSIAKQHALLKIDRHLVILQPVGGPVMVNGSQSTTGAELKDGDIIGIGRMALRINQKAGYYASATYKKPFDALAHSHPQFPTSQTFSAPGVAQPIAVCTGTIILAVVAGPYANQSYQSGPGILRIGRDAGCTIGLPQDVKLSRTHADIQWDGANWSVRDLNSSNGLWVNGVRVAYRLLSIGDQIGVGQSVFRVDSL